MSLNKRKNSINTNPDYQRPSVWTTRQKQLLMDSILRDYDIPKIYLNKVSKDSYDVVDGQQRIRTIWSFFNNEFSLSKDADKVNGIDIAGKTYNELDPNISDIIDTYNLDFIILEDKSEDEIREMFLRLQNGTSLKAQEKRNAIPSKMRDFVKQVTNHNFFDKVNFKDSRFTYDLVAAQMCRLGLKKTIVNIKDNDLNKMYWENKDFDFESSEAKNITKILDYLLKMFPEKSPELKRYNVISLFILIMDMLPNYDIRNREKELNDWFINFELKRTEDSKKDPDEQNPVLVTYHEKISNTTDAMDALQYRHKVLKESLLENIKNLPLKDSKRNFDESQKQVIFRRDKGKCQICR